MLRSARPLSRLLLCTALISLLPQSLALINTTCPSDIQHYNASGLLGFFDSIISHHAADSSSSSKPTIDHDGYLYPTDDKSPSPPASFAYALTVSESTLPANNDTLTAIVATLLITAPLNSSSSSENTTATNSSGVACALPILNLPIRTTRLGQSDDGTCTSTFPHGCAKKILNQIANQSMQWPRASNNLEAQWQGVCSAFASALEHALELHPGDSSAETPMLPSECTSLFQEEVDDPQDNGYDDPDVTGRFISSVKGFRLTSPNSSTPINNDMPNQCDDLPVVDDTLGREYTSFPFYNDTAVYYENATVSFAGLYDEYVRKIYPIVTLILRVAEEDVGLEQDVEILSAHLGCVRTTGFTEGSRKSPELQALDVKKRLSGGTIAGIVVGVVLGVGLVAGLVWWLAKRWRKENRRGGMGGRVKMAEKYEMIDR